MARRCPEEHGNFIEYIGETLKFSIENIGLTCNYHCMDYIQRYISVENPGARFENMVAVGLNRLFHSCPWRSKRR